MVNFLRQHQFTSPQIASPARMRHGLVYHTVLMMIAEQLFGACEPEADQFVKLAAREIHTHKKKTKTVRAAITQNTRKPKHTVDNKRLEINCLSHLFSAVRMVGSCSSHGSVVFHHFLYPPTKKTTIFAQTKHNKWV